MPSKKDIINKLAFPTDAVSMDIETAILYGLDWEIKNYEFKRLFGKRLPDLNYEDIFYAKKNIDKYKVNICSLSPGFFKEELESDQTKSEISKIEKIIEMSEELQVDRIIVFGFKVTENVNEKNIEIISKKIIPIYEKILNLFEKKKITLLIENERNNFMNYYQIIQDVFKNIDSRYLKINWDPCNIINEKHQINAYPDFYNKISNYVGHMHIKDGCITNGKFENKMIGEGIIDWKKQFKDLISKNYEGYFVVEPHFGHRIHSTNKHLENLKKIINKVEE